MHRSKQTFDGTVITEDSAELYDPTEASQRVLVTMKLVQSTYNAVEKFFSSYKQLRTPCSCTECQNATHFLLLIATKKKLCYIVPAPFYASVPDVEPSQLRVFKKPCKVGGTGSCYALYPAQPPTQWQMQLNKPEVSNGAAVRDETIEPDCIRVVCAVEGVGAGMNFKVRIVPPQQPQLMPKPLPQSPRQPLGSVVNVSTTVKHVASNCNEVLNCVANVELGEIPTKYCLTFSGCEKHSSGWLVRDDGPFCLDSFKGETLYLYSRKVDSTSAALDEWITQIATSLKEPTSVRMDLQKLAKGEGWWLDVVNHATPVLLTMSGRCLSTFHESLYGKHPQKQLIRFLESRLHPIGDSLVVRYMQPIECVITVLNKSSKPIIVEAKLSDSFTLADGIDAEVKPRSVFIPEGKGHSFVLVLIGTAVQPADIKNTLKPHALCFWATPVDPRSSKDKKSEVQAQAQGGQSPVLLQTGQSLQQTSIPYIVPFKYIIAPDNKVADLDSLPFVALDMMRTRETFSPVQDCRVETVEFQGVVYVRKMLTLDVLLKSFNSGSGEEDDGPADPQQVSIVLAGVRKMLASIARMRHPCLSSVRWTVHDPRADALFLLFRYDVPPPTLYEILYKQEQTIPLPLRVKIAIDVGLALKKLHYFGFCLGSLNLNSICLKSVLFNCFDPKWQSGAPNAIITDFAYYNDLSLLQMTAPDPDMVPFVAPELIEIAGTNKVSINLAKRTPASDIFSYALVILSLLSQEQPFMDRKGQLWNTNDDLLLKIAREHYMPTLTRLEFQPQILSTIHTSLWNPVTSRPCIDEILNALYHCMNVCAASPQPASSVGGESGDQMKPSEKKKTFRPGRSKSLFFGGSQQSRNSVYIPSQPRGGSSTVQKPTNASGANQGSSPSSPPPPLPPVSVVSITSSASCDCLSSQLKSNPAPPPLATEYHIRRVSSGSDLFRASQQPPPPSSLKEGQTVTAQGTANTAHHRQSPSQSSFGGEKSSALVRVIGICYPKVLPC